MILKRHPIISNIYKMHIRRKDYTKKNCGLNNFCFFFGKFVVAIENVISYLSNSK